ncbi:MAG: FAD-dependent oxidoreductase [Actinobacteria bacterium]|nr:FAD-dependent oxidoreductase [Actinomycetota bacterium]
MNGYPEPDWSLSVTEWLSGLPLTASFIQDVITPFLYLFVTMPLERMGEASALYAISYFVRNIRGGAPPASGAAAGTPTFQTFQNLTGLHNILTQALTASGCTATTNARVTAVAPSSDGVTVSVNGTTVTADHVVMACDPNTSARLLQAGGTADQQLIAGKYSGPVRDRRVATVLS